MVVFITTLLVSCSSKIEGEIVGKWNKTDGAETMEFLKDGTVLIVKEEEIPSLFPNLFLGRERSKHKETKETRKVTSVGNYKFIGNDRIKIELTGINALNGATVAGVSITDDELTFIMPDGDISKYRKMK